MVAALNPSKKAFVVQVAYLSSKIITHLAWKAQIVLLFIEEVVILIEYLNYANLFWKESAIELFERFDINKHIIDPQLGK